MYCLGKPSTLCIYFVIIIIITFLYISESINVFIYLVTYRPIGPGAFCVFVYNCVNVCTSHNNKPFTYLFTYLYHSHVVPGYLLNGNKENCETIRNMKQ